MTQNNKDVIRGEVKKRLLAQRSFLHYCKYIDHRYPIDAPHIKLMTSKLEKVKLYLKTQGREGISRLMIFMPPRYWKSETGSKKFPSFVLGDLPDTRIILTSYGADLASKHSRGVRDIIESEEYSQLFGGLSSTDEPVLLDPESRSAAAWDLKDHNGGMIAAGVGGAIVGFGANLFIIDDPFKSREEASSKTRRENIYEWFRSVAYTRLEDHAAMIIIMTRWDQEDVAGELLKAMVSDPEADQWEVLNLRAEALDEQSYPQNEEQFIENLLRGTYIPMGGDPLGRKAGEPLWPEKHSAEMLKSLRANIGDYEFEAQYNQSPRLAVGEFLDDEDFHIVDHAPDGLKWYWPCDLAIGESETSDFNVTGGIAMKDEDIYVRDVIKVRDLDEFLKDYRDVMLSDEGDNAVFGIESVAFQKLVLKQFLRDPSILNREIVEITLSGRGDKVERARPWRARAKKGKLHLVRGRWNTEFIRIATAFPRGRHDDEVDFVSNGFQMIAEDSIGSHKTVSARAIVVSAESLFA